MSDRDDAIAALEQPYPRDSMCLVPADHLYFTWPKSDEALTARILAATTSPHRAIVNTLDNE